MASLREAGDQDMLPSFLLARAACFRHTHDYIPAHQDLQEVFDLAEPSGMIAPDRLSSGSGAAGIGRGRT